MNVESVFMDLMHIDSQNPDLNPDCAGEQEIAKAVSELLVQAGAEVESQPVIADRHNVVGVLGGSAGAGTIVLEAHLDTVPVVETTRGVEAEGRRFYGRGACDTKASLAAMIVATQRLARSNEERPTVILAGVVDEEYIMRGAEALLGSLPKDVDAIVIGEPTSLLPVRANNGFMRVSIGIHGESAHSSKPHLGVNAINQAARVITELEERLGAELRAQSHPVTGPAVLNPTMIQGGIAPNVVPNYVEVMFDRRVSPSEEAQDALNAIGDLLAELRADGVDVRMHEPLAVLPGYLTDPLEPIVQAAVAACSEFHGRPVEASGVTYSTDACYLGASGTFPCVVLGPGSIDQAHTDEEWVDLDELVQSVALYESLVREFGKQMKG